MGGNPEKVLHVLAMRIYTCVSKRDRACA